MSAGTHLPPAWARRLAQLIGVPEHRIPVAVALFGAWSACEGGSARWNPLNTTELISGSWLYNSAGVRNYRHATAGVAATGITITNGYYNGLVAALQSSQLSALEIARRHADEIKKWGTNPDCVITRLGGKL